MILPRLTPARPPDGPLINAPLQLDVITRVLAEGCGYCLTVTWTW
jgi:hypothetical protein